MSLTTKPSTNGDKALPKRNGPKGLMPLSWTQRTVRIQYTDAFGNGVESSGTLLDFYPIGPVLNLNGAMTMPSWDCIALFELQPDR
jgi:hypothetical protein